MPPKNAKENNELWEEVVDRLPKEAKNKHLGRLAWISQVKVLAPIVIAFILGIQPVLNTILDSQNKDRDRKLEQQRILASESISESREALKQISIISETVGSLKKEKEDLEKTLNELNMKTKTLEIRISQLEAENHTYLAEKKNLLEKIKIALSKYPDLESLFANSLDVDNY